LQEASRSQAIAGNSAAHRRAAATGSCPDQVRSGWDCLAQVAVVSRIGRTTGSSKADRAFVLAWATDHSCSFKLEVVNSLRTAAARVGHIVAEVVRTAEEAIVAEAESNCSFRQAVAGFA